jgi:hypothetical protein
MMILFGSVYVLLREHKKLRNTTQQRPPILCLNRGTYHPPTPPPRSFPAGLPPRANPVDLSPRAALWWQALQNQLAASGANELQIVREWKRAMRNLVQDAMLQMGEAQKWWDLNNIALAIFSASTAVEKMARALLHCHGIRPELDFGQAEALRLMQAVYKESQGEPFQKSIEFMEKITALRRSTETLDNTTAKETMEEATRTFELYKRIIKEKFSIEIEEEGLLPLF